MDILLRLGVGLGGVVTVDLKNGSKTQKRSATVRAKRRGALRMGGNPHLSGDGGDEGRWAGGGDERKGVAGGAS